MIFESFIKSQKVNNVKHEAKRENINNFESFRDFSLFNNSIFEIIIFVSSQSQFIREILFENQL